MELFISTLSLPDINFDTSLNFEEKVDVKVKRYNSPLAVLKRWLTNSGYFHVRKVEERISGKGYVTVFVRRYNQETQSLGPIEYIVKDKPNIRTNAGVTFFAQQCYQTSGLGTNGTNYLALSADTTAPAAADTTIASEINNTNGMGRVQATVALGTAASSSITVTLSHTWTATGTVSNIQKGGLFDTATINTGNLGHEFTFTPTTVNSGDQLTIQVTVTVS